MPPHPDPLPHAWGRGDHLADVATDDDSGDKSVILEIENLGRTDLAYQVVTRPSVNPAACHRREIFQHDAMVLGARARERRSECGYRDDIEINIDRVETVELPRLSAWYVSRVPPSAVSLDTHMRIAQRWMRGNRGRQKPHWVFSSGGYPVAHGEESQAQAFWGVLSWATAQTPIKGLVVTEAGDYDVLRGLRTAAGRYRPIVDVVMRAEKGLQETVAPQ